MEPPHTPSRRPHRQEATTRKKAKFFEAVDTRTEHGKTIKDICVEKNIPMSTGGDWLRLRKLKGSPGTRRHGKLRSGRPSKVDQSTYNTLLDINNPVRDQKPERQLQYHKVPVVPRTLQRNSQKYTKNAQMYKQRPAKQVSVLVAECRPPPQ